MKSIRRQYGFAAFTGALALTSLTIALPVQAERRYVNPLYPIGRDNFMTCASGRCLALPNLCYSEARPCLTIAHAVAFALPDDEIVLMSSRAVAFGDINVVVDKNLAFTGDCPDCEAGRVKLSGRLSGRHFDIRAGATVTMSNLELYDGGRRPPRIGPPTERGGSILNGGRLTLTNCHLHDNIANKEGGAVYVMAGAYLDVGDVDGVDGVDYPNVFQNNGADDGGAVFSSGGDVSVTRASFIGNQALEQSGGAIKHEGDGTLDITDSEFIGNRAAEDGGAVADVGTGALLRVTYSQFSANSANRGGAILAASEATSTVTTAIDAVTFRLNSAVESGGAIHYEPAAGVMTIVNSTFSENNSTGWGGAIDNSGSGPGDVRMELASTTFFGSSALFGAAIYNTRPLEMNNSIVTDSRDLNNNYVDACSNFDSITGSGNWIGSQHATPPLSDRSCNSSATFSAGYVTDFDSALSVIGPELGAFDAPTLTHGLGLTSNAIDSVPLSRCKAPGGVNDLEVDQRTGRRPQGASCDAGAVEQR